MNERRVTMKDVAARAQVSRSTVSLAFNDSARLADETVQSVFRAAAELGYSRDPIAYMLRTKKTNSLGLLLPQQLDRVLENPYYSQFLQGIGQTCQQEGYTLLLVPPLRGSMLKTIPYAAVDGFIVSGLERDRGEVEALRQRGTPFVLVDSEFYDGVPSVEIDDAVGTQEVTRHLLELGHRRIAILAFETDRAGGYQAWRGSTLRRMQGVISALEPVGLTPESAGITVLEVPCTRLGGAQAFTELWKRPDRPTAIIAFSDIIAFGVLDTAREAGVSVPGEVSVTGFDDLAEASWISPALTTIRQPITTKGRLAAEYLVETLTSDTRHRPGHQLLNTSLLLRQSTGPAPDSSTA
ncbi:MAG: LacI family DNA-binding transcriptional regulator [Propionibacteriaceae bacterium]|jgi:DNA-binding LacI/PurR family transcriptional regulator|nr:LacI family DNA-binding transcriptional regulator [Propionibacteriaceae bacterium]